MLSTLISVSRFIAFQVVSSRWPCAGYGFNFTLEKNFCKVNNVMLLLHSTVINSIFFFPVQGVQVIFAMHKMKVLDNIFIDFIVSTQFVWAVSYLYLSQLHVLHRASLTYLLIKSGAYPSQDVAVTPNVCWLFVIFLEVIYSGVCHFPVNQEVWKRGSRMNTRLPKVACLPKVYRQKMCLDSRGQGRRHWVNEGWPSFSGYQAVKMLF